MKDFLGFFVSRYHNIFSVLGLSNFNSKQVDEVCSGARIKPAVLQCESHPYLIQKELINHIKRYDIVCKCPLLLVLVRSRDSLLNLETGVSYLGELLSPVLGRLTYGIMLVRLPVCPSVSSKFPRD